MRRDYHRNLADRERELTTLIQGRTRTLAGRAERKALEDVEGAAQVDKKFADLGLGIVDASIVAMAERLDVRRILTGEMLRRARARKALTELDRLRRNDVRYRFVLERD